MGLEDIKHQLHFFKKEKDNLESSCIFHREMRYYMVKIFIYTFIVCVCVSGYRDIREVTYISNQASL